jgi:hypothetical protein
MLLSHQQNVDQNRDIHIATVEIFWDDSNKSEFESDSGPFGPEPSVSSVAVAKLKN